MPWWSMLRYSPSKSLLWVFLWNECTVPMVEVEAAVVEGADESVDEYDSRGGGELLVLGLFVV